MFKLRMFVFALLVTMVAVNILETEAAKGEEKAESYQNFNLRSYHPKKVEIVFKHEEHKEEHGKGI